jgi:hypothetical protein
MPMLRLHRPIALLVALLAWPTGALAQRAGIVTGLEGNVTVARAAVPEPMTLRFRDDVFFRDRITAGDRSLARILLGGKAVVTVRERSVLTITETPGRATVDLHAGKIGLSVAREKMAPGERIEIRTPNAVAAVRGTVVIAEVRRLSAQIVPGPIDALTLFWVLKDVADVFELDQQGNPGPSQPVPSGRRFQRTGLATGATQDMAPGEEQAVVADFQTTGKSLVPGATQEIVDGQVTQAADLAGVLSGTPEAFAPPLPGRPPAEATGRTQTISGAPILPGGDEVVGGATGSPPPPTEPPVVGPNLLVNSGFETGDFTGWSIEQADGEDVPAAVLGSFGPVLPPEGMFFALLHTGPGAVDLGEACAVGAECRRASLRQRFVVEKADALVQVRGRAILLSNEFPDFTGPGPGQIFKDTFRVRLLDDDGNAMSVFETTVNDQHDNFVPVDEAIGVGFFLNKGAGIADLGEFRRTLVVPTGGVTLEASIADVSDDAFPSGVLLDDLVAALDPPLYFLREGDALVRGPGQSLLRLDGGSHAFDSLLVVCCGATADVGGALLDAGGVSLSVPYGLVAAIQGGSLTSTADGALVRLDRGRYRLGQAVGMFEIWGMQTAADPDTGLVLGTDQPVRHPGTFLEASAATIATRTVVQVDTALLEASRPLVDLRAGSRLTTEVAALVLSHQGQVTSLGPLVTLDASALRTGGPVIDIHAGALRGSGSLLRLANGSTVTALGLARVRGGGVLDWRGPLATFSGAGNQVSLTNAWCAPGGCVTAGGLTVALRGGARAANVRITRAEPWVGGGAVSLAPGGAHLLVSGAGSRVRIQ